LKAASDRIETHRREWETRFDRLDRYLFEDLGASRSRLVVRWKPVRATDEQIAAFDAAHSGMSGGFKGTFEQLENYLKTL
jgi:hypothetical protein